MGEPSASVRDERLPRAARLCHRPEFERCYREGRRLQAADFAVHWRVEGGGPARVGVTASRKVGCSVQRHLLKRWTREVFRRTPMRPLLEGCDLVVHFKPGAPVGGFPTFRADLERLLGEVARRRSRS